MYFEGVRVVMVIIDGMDTATRVKIADCILHSINILAKGMNPTDLPPAMGK